MNACMHEWMSEWIYNISNRVAELAFKYHHVSDFIKLQYFFSSGKISAIFSYLLNY